MVWLFCCENSFAHTHKIQTHSLSVEWFKRPPSEEWKADKQTKTSSIRTTTISTTFYTGKIDINRISDCTMKTTTPNNGNSCGGKNPHSMVFFFEEKKYWNRSKMWKKRRAEMHKTHSAAFVLIFVENHACVRASW